MTSSEEMADVFQYISIPTANKNLIKISGTVTKEGHEFMTNAVSNHDGLKSALKELVRCVRGGDKTAGISMDDALLAADEALTEAEGGA